jgi:hypothetical protein
MVCTVKPIGQTGHSMQTAVEVLVIKHQPTEKGPNHNKMEVGAMVHLNTNPLVFHMLHQGTLQACPISVKVNLVDPASSRMLLSRAKPCKSQSKRNNSGSANGSLYQR